MGQRVSQLLALYGTDGVHLVEDRPHRCVGLGVELRGDDERGWRTLGRVREVDDDIRVLERTQRGAAHGTLELIFRVEEPGGVEDDHLHVVSGADAHDAVAGGLRLLAHDGELLTHDAVEQGGFARVGLPDDGDDPSAWHERKIAGDREGGR
jgi:hypothetical protein